MERRCIYDPLHELMAFYADAQQSTVSESRENLSIEDALRQRIVNGDRLGLEADLMKALETYAALDIINNFLLDGMKVVGELFGSGQMQLPFVLQSAETMKNAVALLEPYMDKVEDATGKGTMVLATVKGDVHDIGKNLVDIILSNNGYRVVNLGIKVPLETMLHAVEEHRADALGMSGLLVKSTAIMKENLEQMQARGLNIPVVLGGAALNRRFVEKDLRQVYTSTLAYAQDAFDGLSFMQELAEDNALQRTHREADVALGMEAKMNAEEMLSTEERAARDVYEAAQRPGAAALGMADRLAALDDQQPTEHVDVRVHDDGSHQRILELSSDVSRTETVPIAPFFGSKVVRDVALEKVYEYINEVALIRGQWQLRRGKLSDIDYERLMREEAYPALNALKLQCKREQLLQPAVVYGYFPCKADGNDLVIYRSKHDTDLHAPWSAVSPQNIQADAVEEWTRFHFPRQHDGRHLCLSDFFRPLESPLFDVVSFQIVTVGARATDYAHSLFSRGEFRDYLYFHGLSVEAAEALAEYWHKIVRAELGIVNNDSPDIRALFSQGYQGSRYSFGYPACPHLEDQTKLFELLRPERVDISLTEEFQLVPEQSTSAIVCHHREARYFNVK